MLSFILNDWQYKITISIRYFIIVLDLSLLLYTRHHIIEPLRNMRLLLLLLLSVSLHSTLSRVKIDYSDRQVQSRIDTEIRINRHASFPLSVVTINMTLISTELANTCAYIEYARIN